MKIKQFRTFSRDDCYKNIKCFQTHTCIFYNIFPRNYLKYLINKHYLHLILFRMIYLKSINENTLHVHVLLLCDFSDLRPKGRGRPQRILLGVWPDEHIRGVIRAVVFRDTHAACAAQATNLKELELPGYPPIAPVSIAHVARPRAPVLTYSAFLFIVILCHFRYAEN